MSSLPVKHPLAGWFKVPKATFTESSQLMGRTLEQTFEVNLSGNGFQTLPPLARLAGVLGVPSLVLASDGNLWGTTFEGGVTGDGSIFALSPTGVVVLSFSFDGANGSLPLAIVIQGTDGKIYGMATLGGTDLEGHLASGTVWALDAALPAPGPIIKAFVPSSAQAGSKIAIRGTNLTGSTAVSFNGANAKFTVLNANFIAAIVPPGTSAGPIAVTNAGGTTHSKQEFTPE